MFGQMLGDDFIEQTVESAPCSCNQVQNLRTARTLLQLALNGAHLTCDPSNPGVRPGEFKLGARISLTQLQRSDQLATQSGMRGAIFHLWCILAVLLAGIHAPASAHDVFDREGTMHLAGIAEPDGHDDQGENSPATAGQELMHHHHCPMVVDFAGSRPLFIPLVANKLPRPGLAQALPSRALVPPLHPPAA